MATVITGILHITYRWAKRKVVYNWFGMDIMYWGLLRNTLAREPKNKNRKNC